MTEQNPSTRSDVEAPALRVAVKPAQKHKRFNIRNIAVTKDEILGAIRSNSHLCMIAEAIKRQVPNATGVIVDLQSVRFSDRKRGVRIVCDTPRDCQEALVKFDRGFPCEPFTFNLSSKQVTNLPKRVRKLDAEGKPISKTVTRSRRLSTGETVVRQERQPVYAESVSRGRKVHTNNRADASRIGDHTSGGLPPPVAKLSAQRVFGLRAFTWDADKTELEAQQRWADLLGVAVPEPRNR